MGLRGTVWWGYSKNPGNSPDGLLQRQHPATFPLQLASDLIRWLAPEGGVVLDPMIGSGTTAIAAIKSGRRCVGFDINGGYLETAKKRVALAEAAATIADLLPLDEAVD